MSTDVVISIRKLLMEKPGPALRSSYTTAAGMSGTNGEPQDSEQPRAQTAAVQQGKGLRGETWTHKPSARLCKNEWVCAMLFFVSLCLQDHLKCLCCQVFLPLGHVRTAVFKRD